MNKSHSLKIADNIKSMHNRIPRLPVFKWNNISFKKSGLEYILHLDNVVYTTSGRASIFLALKQLGICAKDKVLMPTYHCPTMIAPVEILSGQVIFYPITSSGTPDIDWLNQLNTSDVKVILVAHLFGLPQPMKELKNWCEKKRILMIEDCAHAIFGKSDGRPIGTWGDIAIASLTKFFPLPEGGCLIYNNISLPRYQLGSRKIKDHIRCFFDILETSIKFSRPTGLYKELVVLLKFLKKLIKSTARKTNTKNQFSLTNNSAINIDVATRKIAFPSKWLSDKYQNKININLRRRNYNLLSEALSGNPSYKVLFPVISHDCVPYVFPLWVEFPDPGYSFLIEAGFPVSRWDQLWPETPKISGDYGFDWSYHVLQLACHQDLTEADISEMIKVIKNIY